MSAQEPPAPIARLTVPAEPASLALCRHALAAATRGAPLSDGVVEDLKLVLSEVCKNAIEHGYRWGPGTIEIEVCGLYRVRVGSSFDVRALRRVLDALKNR